FKQMIGRGTRLFPEENKLSFDVIDYAGATRLFSDPEFDGPPERVDVEEIDTEGNVLEEATVEEPEFDAGNPADVTIDPDDLDQPPLSKYYVDEGEVWVTAEAIYHLDPATERLRLVEYREYVAETVRQLFPDINELRSRWSSRVGRDDVRDMLAGRGIEVGELAQRAALVDADPLDILVFIAWNMPLASRADRARRVWAKHTAFFEAYQPAARQVLTLLLDKYATHGVSELDDLAALSTMPLSELGSPTEIAGRFGSAEGLRSAVEQLGKLIYAA
ncbi:MAG TPA: type I restriction-modification enzyme R subunit C-terminal domain-containing protein, partial [Candidatus Dormibacteraeota bacterium]